MTARAAGVAGAHLSNSTSPQSWGNAARSTAGNPAALAASAASPSATPPVEPPVQAQETAPAASEPQTKVEVEYHAASLSYIHRIVDPNTGRTLQQLPAAQVLDLVDDLMKQIRQE